MRALYVSLALLSACWVDSGSPYTPVHIRKLPQCRFISTDGRNCTHEGRVLRTDQLEYLDIMWLHWSLHGMPKEHRRDSD